MMTSRSTTALCLLSLLSTSCSSLASAPVVQQQPSITYKEIGDPLIAAIGFVDKEKKELTQEEKTKALKEIPQLSDGEKLKLVFEILDAHGQVNAQNMPVSSYQAMRTTSKELELFFAQGSNSTKHLFSKINHTTTVMGQAALAKMMMEPIDDIQKLRNRQAFVRELVNNGNLFNELNSLLSSLAQKESDLFSFWQKTNPVSEQVIAMLYLPIAKTLNSNSFALSSWRTFINGLRLAQTTFYASATFYLAKTAYATGSIALQKNPTLQTQKKLLINASTAGVRCQNFWRLGYIPEHQEKMLKDLTRNLENPNIVAETYAQSQPTLNAIAMQAGSLGLNGSFLALIMYMTARQMKQEYVALKYMQTRLSGVAALLTTTEKLQNLVSHNDVATHGLFMQQMGIAHLEQQKKKLEKLQTLISHLEAKTFAGDYSFFSNSGRILAAFNLIQDVKNEFVGLMQAVGEIDACLSIAKLYMSLQENSNATYCFVDYVEQDTPYLHLENFWNPIIDPSLVVTNSIELGGTQSPRNIVVTGSNTGGKSTILKAVVANIMLSRLGIAPARVAVMTPFTYLATSMNIGDDTAGGVSLFKAEVLRAKSILSNVKSLQLNQFAFLAIDELFVGTASEKGEEAACRFAEALNALPNTMFTFATHFKKATTLEQRTNGTCKNYMVEAFKNDNGEIVRPFKLEAGISTSNIANDILQENISSIDFLESSVDVLA